MTTSLVRLYYLAMADLKDKTERVKHQTDAQSLCVGLILLIVP